ncbi:acyltransferase [Variovorax sp. KBW07]|uniref:acyltransferase family protein n=1 Tax=Variovorax sp. KBW07 TaxID=2153358 RepID=UPI000F5684A5|nr:acyltransferase [Variovorax sp. KBW07]RQO55447.1 acyltransferase [Variovorax sp. KBW07]
MHAAGSTAEHQAFLNTRFFPALDGLRAISVFLVFGAHFGGVIWITRAGWLGVHAFFVLSGFLITTLLLRERSATGSVSLKAFYIRRSTRLLPVYYLVFLVVLGMNYAAQGVGWEQLKQATPYYLVFLNELANFSPFGMTWTLGVEWKYYAVWSVLLAMFGATMASRFTVAAVCLAVLAAVWVGRLDLAWFAPVNYLGVLLGSVMAIVMHSPSTYAWLRWLRTNAAAAIIVIALFFVHRRASGLTASIGEHQMVAIYVVLVALLLPGLIAPTFVGRVLSMNFLGFIGRRSYSLYLVQYVAWTLFVAAFPNVMVSHLALVGNFALALVLSEFLYRWVEKPMTRVGHRWAEAARPAAQAARGAAAATAVDGVVASTPPPLRADS